MKGQKTEQKITKIEKDRNTKIQLVSKSSQFSFGFRFFFCSSVSEVTLLITFEIVGHQAIQIMLSRPNHHNYYKCRYK